MKRKSLTLMICLLAAFALASIGFASWIITNPDASTEEEGTITVDDVESEVFEIGAEWSTDNKIKFGVPSGYSAKTTDWLTNDSGNVDFLEAILVVKITAEDSENLESALTKAPITVTLSGKKSDEDISTDNLNSLFTNANLPAPVLQVKDLATGEFVAFDGTIDYADLNAESKCEIKVVFSWGTNGNPYTYYNAKAFKDYHTEAETFLKGVYTALNGLSYKITIK